MNNYEKIKNMTIEEMAEFLGGNFTEDICNYCTFVDACSNGCKMDCKEGMKQWLESEVE